MVICALADGQGGRDGGGAAAQNAVHLCLEYASTHSPGKLVDPSTWVSICEAVDRQICAFPEAGYTTLIGLTVGPAFVAGASSGDSAVVLLLGDQFVVLTERRSEYLDAEWKADSKVAKYIEPWKHCEFKEYRCFPD